MQGFNKTYRGLCNLCLLHQTFTMRDESSNISKSEKNEKKVPIVLIE